MSSGDRVELSPTQLGLWIQDQIDGPSSAYNMPMVWRLAGALDAAALAWALSDLIERHTPLRTLVQMHDGEPGGHLAPPPAPQTLLRRDDIESLASQHREGELAALIAAELARPFDLSADPLLRARLIRVGAHDHALVLVMHHSAGDGMS